MRNLSPPLDRSRSSERWLIAFVVLASAAAFGFAFTVFLSAPLSVDEAWSVVVVGRMLHGERLYRDVFIGTTPFAFQCQFLAASLAVNGILTARILTTLLIAGQLLASQAIASVLGLGMAWRIPLLGSGLLWIGLLPDSLYSELATLLLLLAMYASLRASIQQSSQWLLWGAVICGLAVASKQNTGVLTVIAFSVSLSLHPQWRWTGNRIVLFSFGMAGPLLLCLAPTLAHGDFDAFLRFTLFNKSTYVSKAGFDYFAQLNLTPYGEIRARGLLLGMNEWVGSLPYLLPFVVLALAFAAHVRKSINYPVKAVLIFTLAALLSVYPRPDPLHFRMAVPSLLIAMLACANRLLHPSRNLERSIVGAAVMVVLSMLALDAPRAYETTAVPVREHSPLRGLRLRPGYVASIESQSAELGEVSVNDHVLLIHPAAPILYLISGLRNPTPYDYPMVTPFGPRGQADVLEAIERGRILDVCLRPAPWEALEPTQLTSGIPRMMRLVHKGVVCDRYQRLRP